MTRKQASGLTAAQLEALCGHWPGIIPAPYLARAHWISVIEPSRFATAELAAFILDAYVLVRAKLTKKLQAELGPLPTLKAGRK